MPEAYIMPKECLDPIKAINFACDKLEDDVYAVWEFLKDWRKGDLREWPDFEDYCKSSTE